MHNRYFLNFLVAVLATLVCACDQQPTDKPATVQAQTSHAPAGLYNEDGVPMGRLPRDVLPVHYRIELEIIPEKTTFTGHVEIDLEFTRPKSDFYIHGERLRVSASRLELPSGGFIPAQYEEYKESGVAHISLADKVSGPATLVIDYEADFNGSLEALYRVKSGGDYYAFTQFEAISARLAFPGFDEPSFKVTFDQFLVVDEAHEAITGTPAIETRLLENGRKRIRYATTKPLPTYLLAYAVGPLDIVTAPDLPATDVRDRPLPLRGIAARGKGKKLGYALENTEAILTSLENYFGIPYPYAKLDILAVPDFDAGAMENAGAITYREQLLLFDESSGIKDKRNYQRVHAHELAHQWFGDLVTPYWWNDIWLNEAFATWMSYVALDIWRPDAGFRRDLNERMLTAMTADSMISARQITQPVLSNDGIATAFDSITYSKGGGVINMFEGLLGRETFRKGVQSYMEEFAFANASSADFIASLAAQSTEIPPEKLESAFRSFLDQPGLPLVDATLTCNDSSATVALKQSRYLPLGSAGDPERLWQIPICLNYAINGGAQRACLLLTEPEQQFELPVDQCPDYLMPNADGAGYYRWSMPDKDWNRVLTALDLLSTEEAMSLAESLNGAFNAGNMDVEAYYKVAQQFANSENWELATAPLLELGFIRNSLANSEQLTVLEEQYSQLYSNQLDRAGLSAPSDNDHAILQEKVVNFMADHGRIESLREDLKQMAWAYTGYEGEAGFYPEQANSNLIGIALRIAIELDDAETTFAKHLLDLTLASDDATTREDALTALGYVAAPDMADRMLELVLSDEIRNNEFKYILKAQIGQGITQDATWYWLKDNIDSVIPRLPTWDQNEVIDFGELFCNTEKRKELKEFFTPRLKEIQGAARQLAKNLEKIDLCIAKKAFHQASFEQFMESR